ncbi:hypothetical protein CIPAW_03G043800 [Carya illinoinensis]|uniref:Glycosylphosphatidylinositol anchor attachment 1 protein n=1 Tax=Carya illinoinensis TaxID=32201 RepID=A0A8T1R086_CARIL|nr:hypothetical protein CIPAW_03G043800 [Carya illinoinensis]
MAESEAEAPKAKPRPIVRLGIFLISHSFLFSVICCTAGVLTLLLLPVLAKNTYISENALMPGSANPMFSSQEVSEANRLVKSLTSLDLKPEGSGIESQRLIAEYMSDLGAEISYHKFYPRSNQFHPLHFFSYPDSGSTRENISCISHGLNTVGIIRAPRGDGKEAIVLVTPYNSLKDIIWLVADSRYGEYTAVDAWLRDYHMPVFSGLTALNAEICPVSNVHNKLKENGATERKIHDGFRRAGTMAAALVIKVKDGSEHFEDSLSIYAEASNGQMPNLDLINIVNYLAVHRQGLRVKVGKMQSLINCKWLKILGEILQSLGHVAKSLKPQWKFGIPAADYVEGAATLASSLYYQALGVPTGPHGAFRDYEIDAITMEISSRVALNNKARKNDFLLRGGRLIEGVIRTVNNLLEKFHQSFFLYLLTSPSKFVSVGVYMIAFALLVAPLPVVAASLYADAHKVDRSFGIDKSSPQASATDKISITPRSCKWLNAANKVFLVHLWGAVVSFLPYFICQIPSCTPTTSFVVWVLLSSFSLPILSLILGSSFSYGRASQPQKRDWTLLKSVTISAAFIGLCLMSVINFATAEIGALLMVPMCLMAQPLKLDIRSRSLRKFSRVACNLALGFLGSPPAGFFVLKGAFEGFGGITVGDYWNWLESIWSWSSATYLYIGMVHLPCWVLCIHVLLHPC